MIPKIEGCIEVVEAASRPSSSSTAGSPHCVLLELFTAHGVGTLVGGARRKPKSRSEWPSPSQRRRRHGGPSPVARLIETATAADRRGFDATRVWIFDLDNTLYPSACNLFAEVDHRMGAFIAQHLDLPLEHARYLQKRYYHDYGTTLSGLMKLHKIDPHAFLEFVHDIDLAPLDATRTAHAR